MLNHEQMLDLLSYIGASKMRVKQDEISCCCPVHGETNPSFSFNVEKQVGHCFACGFSGDVEWLVFRSTDEFKSINQVIQFLQGRYQYVPDPTKANEGILSYEELSIQKQVVVSPVLPRVALAPYRSGVETYKYFFKRGFTPKTMKDFKIGRDLTEKTVTIPIFTEEDELVGFLGRYIDKTRPKNSRYRVYQFLRGKYLFPLDQFKTYNETCILVEGVLDALWLHQLGFTNCYAILGNQLTPTQANFLRGKFREIIFMFDNDARGQTAIEIAKEKLKGEIISLVNYPLDRHDPQECTQEEIAKMINNRVNLLTKPIPKYV